MPDIGVPRELRLAETITVFLAQLDRPIGAEGIHHQDFVRPGMIFKELGQGLSFVFGPDNQANFLRHFL
jgi:hypothetical protein